MHLHGGSRLQAIWHGTIEETRRLNGAIGRHCNCTTGTFGAVTTVCAVHRMLGDQRVLDHLLYVYRMRDRFEHAEWMGGKRGPLGTVSATGLGLAGVDGRTAGRPSIDGDQRPEARST